MSQLGLSKTRVTVGMEQKGRAHVLLYFKIYMSRKLKIRKQLSLNATNREAATQK